MVSECIFSLGVFLGESEVFCSAATEAEDTRVTENGGSKVRTHVQYLQVTWGQSAARKQPNVRAFLRLSAAVRCLCNKCKNSLCSQL